MSITGIKPAAKYIALGAILIGTVIGLKFLVLDKNDGKLFTPTETAVTAPPAASSSPTASTSGNAEGRTFNYVPVDPVNGKSMGVVEVGASGFNAFAIEADNQGNWKLKYKEFGSSLAKEGLAKTDDIRKGLKDYIGKIAEYGVNGKSIHFVVSSGAQQSPNTQVVMNELVKQGYVVNNVNADQEGKYALRATLPNSFRDNSFVVDIGSGNTKINWYEGDALKTVEAEGAKYTQDGKSDASVYEHVKSLASKIPASKRTVCFVIGGVPYKLASQTRNGEERYTVLNAPGSYTPKNDKEKAGVNIYKAIADATGTDTFVFDWDSNFTIGYLLAVYK